MTLNPWRLRLLSQLDSYGTVRAVAQAANLSASSVSRQLAGLSIALLPSFAVDRRYRVSTRQLAAPVTRSITAAVRRGSPPRAAVNLVLDALRQAQPNSA